MLENNAKRKTLEIGGEEVFTFKRILEIIEELQFKRKLVTVPYGVSKKLAFF